MDETLKEIDKKIAQVEEILSILKQTKYLYLRTRKLKGVENGRII